MANGVDDCWRLTSHRAAEESQQSSSPGDVVQLLQQVRKQERRPSPQKQTARILPAVWIVFIIHVCPNLVIIIIIRFIVVKTKRQRVQQALSESCYLSGSVKRKQKPKNVRKFRDGGLKIFNSSYIRLMFILTRKSLSNKV